MVHAKRRWYGLLAIIFCGNIVLAEQTLRTGQFDVFGTTSELLDSETVSSISEIVSPEQKLSWKLYVPESFDGSAPAALMVYVSPTGNGWIPRDWRSVMDARNMLWIGANSSGNEVSAAKRIILALLAPTVAARDYSIDANRTYIAGFSGGGKIASIVAADFAHRFRGAIYIGGAESWGDDEPQRIAGIRDNRYVFLAGEYDFNLRLTRKIYREYKKADVPNIKLMEVRGLAHRLPNDYYWQKALTFLEPP